MRAVSLRIRPNVAISIVSPNVLGPRLRSMNDVISSSRKNPEILVKPMIASTLPSALARSPRRANGLNSGSTREASLDSRLSWAARRGVQSDSGLLRTLCRSRGVGRWDAVGVRGRQNERGPGFVLDRGCSSMRQHRDGLPLDLRRAGHLAHRVQIGPFRRDPLLVAKQADLRVESLMDDLPRDQLGQQRLPFLTLGVGADLAPESLVAEKESLRQVEQSLPQLVLDPSRAI